MTLSRTHTSSKAADVEKLLLLNKHRVTRPPMRIMAVTPNYNRNHNPTLSLTVILI